MTDTEQRLIVCCNFRAHTDNEKGQSIALYEKDKDTSRLIKINKEKYFSEKSDGEVHIVPNPSNDHNYALLEKKYKNRLYLIQCIENKNIENGSDLSKNKSNLYTVESIEPNSICEVIHSELPDEINPQIEVKQLPLSRHIFIRDTNFSYGPFEYDHSYLEDTTNYILIIKKPGDIKYLGIVMPKMATLKFKNTDLEPFVDSFDLPSKVIDGVGFNHTFISNVSELKTIDKEQINYGFMDELTKAIGTIVKETNTKGITQSQVTLLATRIKNKKNNFNFNTDYVIKQLSDSLKFEKVITEGKAELRNIVLEQALNESEKLKHECLELLKNNESVINDVKASIRLQQTELIEQLSDIQSSVEVKNNELNLIQKSIETAKLKVKEIDEDKVKQVNEELRKKETDLNESISNLEDKQAIILKKYEGIFNYNSLDEELKKIKSEIDKQKFLYDSKVDEVKDKKGEISAQEQELENLKKKSREHYKQELLSVKSSIDVLTQIDNTNSRINFECIGNNKLLLLETPENLVDYLKYIQIILSENDRNISIEQIINLLVCIDLSFITILSGLPGTGKTSLISILSQTVLNSRFNHVQVGRGWSSERDLLGYFNPITNSYISSGTGMYEYLGDIDQDDRFNVVLLDEANLSPIEHYWSKFMGLTDNFEDQTFNFTNNESVGLKNNLRFIATINNDMTTEPISPRLLDRAPCIRLDVFTQLDRCNKTGLDTISENDLSNLKNKFDNNPVAYSEYQKAMNSCKCDQDTLEPLNDIIDHLKAILISDGTGKESYGSRVHLSERRYQIIKNYLDSSLGIYTVFYKNAPVWVEIQKNSYFLDFTISQFILPLINGHGKSFKNRVETIKSELLTIEQKYNYELPISIELICRLLRQGDEDLDTYDFMSLR
jgi:hypothetical protein